MSLMRMGKASESVRFLDDVDVTFSLDSRPSSGRQMTSIELGVKPIIFRASYRDINMITTILNKAISLYGDTQKASNQLQRDEVSATSSVTTRTTQLTGQRVGKARVLMSKEQARFMSHHWTS
jgi:vacuolar protein sorting-associated protein 13A/C